MSKKQTKAVTKLLSKQTADKLEKALAKDNLEQLKKQMEALFTFKNIFNLHDDHLIELAEFVIDASEAEDKLEYMKCTQEYIRKRMSRYKEEKAALARKIQWAKVTKETDEIKMLNLSYQLWIYEAGYKYSEYQMLSMMCGIIRSAEEVEEDNSK